MAKNDWWRSIAGKVVCVICLSNKISKGERQYINVKFDSPVNARNTVGSLLDKNSFPYHVSNKSEICHPFFMATVIGQSCLWRAC